MQLAFYFIIVSTLMKYEEAWHFMLLFFYCESLQNSLSQMHIYRPATVYYASKMNQTKITQCFDSYSVLLLLFLFHYCLSE